MQAFFGNTRGNVALIFALSLLPVTILVGGSVDLSRMRVERTKLQSAVDAASLAATQLPGNATDAAIEATVNSFMAANFDGQGAITSLRIFREGTAVDIHAVSSVPMTFASLLGAETRPVTANAKAERGGVNVEIAMVLDVTGSMRGQKIRDLRTAATDLIDIVVQDVQTPYYTRMAVVPYSAGVNVGRLADNVRGAPRVGRVTDAGWSDGDAKEITDITKESHVRLRSNGHGLQNGETVYIDDVPGMWQINGKAYRVAKRNGNRFRLDDRYGGDVSSRWWSNFSNSTPRGTATKCRNEDCIVEIVAPGHGLSERGDVRISGLDATGELNRLNGRIVVDEIIDNDTFTITGDTFAWDGVYRGGGEFDCFDYGCAAYTFMTPGGWWSSGSPDTYEITDCVSARTGAQAYTDADPRDFPVGIVYADRGNADCPAREIMTLTSNRGQLRSHINGLTDGGNTAGQIGIAWGWYMLSPNFNRALSNNAAAYDAPETLKVAVIMTDGEFNASYCNGVSMGDIDCDRSEMAVNSGDEYDQAEALCEGMAAEGILVYTVGFDLRRGSDAADFMEDCASDASYAYLASNGQQLNSAFRAIGDSIGQLRLTR